MNLEREQLEENEAEEGEKNEEEKVIYKNKEIGGSMIFVVLLLFHFALCPVELLQFCHDELLLFVICEQCFEIWGRAHVMGSCVTPRRTNILIRCQ